MNVHFKIEVLKPNFLQMDKRYANITPRETERGGPCRPIETEVNRDSKNTYDRVSFLDYIPP